MLAKIWNWNKWVDITDPKTLMLLGYKMLLGAGFDVLDFMEHRFTPFGYTAIWLLGESHFAIHTFPEEGKSYLELSSCNKGKYDKFLDLLKSEEEQWQMNRI